MEVLDSLGSTILGGADIGVAPHLVAVAAIVLVLALVFVALSSTTSGGGGVAKKSSAPTALFVGACGSGKTVLYYRLRDDDLVDTHSSLAVNEDTFTPSSGCETEKPLHIVDFPGNERIRPRLKDFLPIAKAIVVVVDSVDFNPRPVAELLLSLFTDQKVKSKKTRFLIACNKSDSITALRTKDVQAALENEIDELRADSSALLDTADESSKKSIDIGDLDKSFKFAHLDNTVEFGSCSAKQGQLKCVANFLKSSF